VEPLPSFLDSKNRKNIDLGRRGELKKKNSRDTWFQKKYLHFHLEIWNNEQV